MAKNKPQRNKKPLALTDEQVRELGVVLINTRFHVHILAQQKFGVKTDDSIFDRLKVIAKIQKCPECGTWLDLEEWEGIAKHGPCNECVTEIDSHA